MWARAMAEGVNAVRKSVPEGNVPGFSCIGGSRNRQPFRVGVDSCWCCPDGAQGYMRVWLARGYEKFIVCYICYVAT